MALSRNLIVIAIATLLTAEVAFAFTCVDSFKKSPALEYAESLNIERTKQIWNRWLWFRFLRRWDDKASYTRMTFEDSLEHGHGILYKLRLQQGRVRETQDFSQRPEEVVRWAEMSIMREGLSAYLGEKPNMGLRNRILYRLQKLYETRAMRALMFTSPLLPAKIDKPISSELLAKITVDGVDKHLAELQAEFKLSGQNKVEAYRRFRKIYFRVYMLVSFVIMVDRLNDETEKQAAERKDEFVSGLEQMDKGLSNLEAMIDSGAFDRELSAKQ